MGVHFITVLGTGLYEPVVYNFKGSSPKSVQQEFVQMAMLDEFQGQILENGKISIFLTEGARKRNWEDRLYNEADVSFSQRWVSQKKQEVQEGGKKAGLESLLKTQYPGLYGKTEIIGIENASTEDEIWSVFEKIYGAIDEGDEIIFDITHSFRSIPMLAITIINYAKVMKNCTLKGIYYGAYEASVAENGVKTAPVVDLAIYNEILEWTNAAEEFMKYGSAAKIKKVYNEKMKTVPNGEKKNWSALRGMVEAMDALSLAVSTCRGTDVMEMGEKNHKTAVQKSVKNAYRNLDEKITEESENKAKEIKPMYLLMAKAKEQYRTYFDHEKNYEVGCGVVKWSVQNNMIQQGYTALEETVKTYLCYCYGIDDKTEETREGIVWHIINGILIYGEGGKKLEKYRDEIAEAICEELGDGYSEYWDKVREVVGDVPLSLVRLCDRVKERRNDINHFGFNTKPAASSTLVDELEDLSDEFEQIIKEWGKA